MCRVKKCCFCIDQHRGVQLLGLFMVIVSGLAVAGGVVIVNQFIIVAGLASLFFNIFLVLDRTQCGLLMWLLISPPAIILIVILGIYLVLKSELDINEKIHLDSLACRISGWTCFAAAGLYCYFWIVVYSLYVTMVEGPIVHPGTGNGNATTSSSTSGESNKTLPPNYSDLVLDPPPPTYDVVVDLKNDK